MLPWNAKYLSRCAMMPYRSMSLQPMSQHKVRSAKPHVVSKWSMHVLSPTRRTGSLAPLVQHAPPEAITIRPSNGLTSVSQSTCRCQVEAVWGRKAEPCSRYSAAKCCLHEGIQAVEEQTGLKACSSQDLGRILQER